MLWFVYGYYSEVDYDDDDEIIEDSVRPPAPGTIPSFHRVVTADSREEALAELADEYGDEGMYFGATQVEGPVTRVRIKRLVEFV